MPKVPGDNVVQMPQAQAQPMPDPTLLLMAAATMHEQGRLFEKPEQSAPQQVAMNEPPKGDVPPLKINPIRSQQSLNRALKNADSDEEVEAIMKRLEKRGYDTSRIR